MPERFQCGCEMPEYTGGIFDEFDVALAKPDPTAKKNCPMCKGRGRYTALHVSEYDEMPMSMKCACTNKR